MNNERRAVGPDCLFTTAPARIGNLVIGAMSFLTPTYIRSTSLGRIRCDDGKLPEENKRWSRPYSGPTRRYFSDGYQP
jgi:hypothetical protein